MFPLSPRFPLRIVVVLSTTGDMSGYHFSQVALGSAVPGRIGEPGDYVRSSTATPTRHLAAR